MRLLGIYGRQFSPIFTLPPQSILFAFALQFPFVKLEILEAQALPE
jgi:hypothetical protein